MAPLALQIWDAGVGVAMLRLNARVKTYFATPDGVRSLQMQNVVTIGQDADPVASANWT